MAEHPATATSAAAAADVVPSTEETTTAVAAETGAGVAFVVGMPGGAAPVGVVAMMHGAEEVVQAHGWFPFVSRVFYDISQECLEQYPGGDFSEPPSRRHHAFSHEVACSPGCHIKDAECHVSTAWEGGLAVARRSPAGMVSRRRRRA